MLKNEYFFYKVETFLALRYRLLVRYLQVYTNTRICYVRVIIFWNGLGEPGSNPEQDYVSGQANTLEKGMNPSLFILAMGKIVGQIKLFTHGMATNLEKGKTLNSNRLEFT